MPLEIKTFSCPNCGAPLTVKNAGRARSVVCPNCHSQIDLTSPEYSVIGRSLQEGPPPRTPLALGMRGTIEGEQYEIIGRVRYREDAETYWDEWLILSEQGRYRWISDGEDGVALWDPFTPTQPVDPHTVAEDNMIYPEGIPARVAEKGSARIDYLEGELTWKAKVGDQSGYIDADYPGGRYSIEWTENEIEFYRGRNLSYQEVAQIFGITPQAMRAAESQRRGTTPASIFSMAVVVLIILVCLCIMLALPSTGSGGSGGFFGGSPSGPSIRGGGSSGGSHSGGGK